MDPTETEVLAALQPFLDQAENAVYLAAAVFARVGAIVFLLPGFGERVVPARVKLGVALAFALAIWPLLPPGAVAAGMAASASLAGLGVMLTAEAVCGLVIGLGVRLMVFALQTAGVMIAQSFSITQMFGSGVAPDPEPTMATFLTLGGVTLALSLGLHVKAVALMGESYQALPLGAFPVGSDVATWSVSRVGDAFAISVSLALPFLVVSFAYNLALGFINRAMPQMMVAFVGLPAITWIGILLFGVIASTALTVWHDRLDVALASPFALNTQP